MEQYRHNNVHSRGRTGRIGPADLATTGLRLDRICARTGSGGPYGCKTLRQYSTRGEGRGVTHRAVLQILEHRRNETQEPDSWKLFLIHELSAGFQTGT